MAKKSKASAKNKLPVSTEAAPAPMSATIATKPSKADKERELNYRAQDALRDIERAEAHKGDGELMGRVKQLAQEKVTSLKKICK